MQEEFDAKLRELCGGGGRILLAVSGGIDSMTMARLFLDSTLAVRFSVAHVNFSLRGEESDGDQQLVEQWCSSNAVQCFVKRVDTKEYASVRGISIEMAAREIRYEWFAELSVNEAFDYVAVAHNLNDSAETMCLNLLRGTGLRGLGGILPVNGNIIRPMLGFSREQISKFAIEKNIQFRNDSTNDESSFSRNRIRNEVFPHFKEINPSFIQTFRKEAERFSRIESLLSDCLSRKEGVLYRRNDNGVEIEIAALKREEYKDYWLFRLLEEYGFNPTQIDAICNSLDSSTGKRFESNEAVALFDRGLIKVALRSEERAVEVKWEISPISDNFNPRNAPEGTLFVDAGKVSLPLIVRKPIDGDRFKPFGMKGSKLLSDYFTDLKLDRFQKECQRVVCDASGNIVCVAGLRIDDRVRIDSDTNEIITIMTIFTE